MPGARHNTTKGQFALALANGVSAAKWACDHVLPVTLKSRPSNLKIGAQISSLKSQTRDFSPTPPVEANGDVAAFARTRVHPGVATNPHSGECGYGLEATGREARRRSRVRQNAGTPRGATTNPHSGECGYPAGSPWLFTIAPVAARKPRTSILTRRVSMLTDSAAAVIGEGSRKKGGEFHDAAGRRTPEI